VLIRSKGVGVCFVTQTPKDVHEDVLAQLGSRIQHQLRAFTPNDADALKATVRTFPTSAYDLEELLTDHVHHACQYSTRHARLVVYAFA
jgi:uncharacterized protein